MEFDRFSSALELPVHTLRSDNEQPFRFMFRRKDSGVSSSRSGRLYCLPGFSLRSVASAGYAARISKSAAPLASSVHAPPVSTMQCPQPSPPPTPLRQMEPRSVCVDSPPAWHPLPFRVPEPAGESGALAHQLEQQRVQLTQLHTLVLQLQQQLASVTTSTPELPTRLVAAAAAAATVQSTTASTNTSQIWDRQPHADNTDARSKTIDSSEVVQAQEDTELRTQASEIAECTRQSAEIEMQRGGSNVDVASRSESVVGVTVGAESATQLHVDSQSCDDALQSTDGRKESDGVDGAIGAPRNVDRLASQPECLVARSSGTAESEAAQSQTTPSLLVKEASASDEASWPDLSADPSTPLRQWDPPSAAATPPSPPPPSLEEVSDIGVCHSFRRGYPWSQES